MPVGAAIGSAVITGGAGLIGSHNAAQASQDATDKSIAFQQGWLDKVHGDIQPFMGLGQQGINALMDPGKFFQTDPGYQFRLQQGTGNIVNNKAVNGLLQSGSALKALDTYNSGLASQEYGNWWNRQSGLVNTGLQAEGLYAGVGTNAANQSSAATMTNGANQGGAAIAGANAVAGFGGSLADLMAKYGGGSSSSSSYSGQGTGIPSEYQGLI